MDFLFENWRQFIQERGEAFSSEPAPKKGASYDELKARWDEFKTRMLSISDVWIFFDTETTGLDDRLDSTQVTELAAGAYDFSNWFKTGEKPEKLNISNIPVNLAPIVNTSGEFSTKVKLTSKVEPLLAKEKRLMKVTDPNDPVHIEYAQAEIGKMASKIAFSSVEQMAANDPSLMVAKGKKKELSQKGWRLWRNAKEEALKTLTPEDVPFYSETHTDDPKEMGYGPGSKSGTLVALLKLGRYGSGEAPFIRDTIVYNSFSQYLELVRDESGRNVVGLMAHNAPFDIKQMNTAYEKAGLTPYDMSVFDSIEVFKKYLVPIVQDTLDKINQGIEVTDRDSKLAGSMGKKNKAGRDMISVSLGPVVKGFELPDLGWHAAIADVRMTAAMFIEAIDYIDNWFRQSDKAIVGAPAVTPEEEPVPSQEPEGEVDWNKQVVDRNTLYENDNFKRRPILKATYRKRI